MKLLHSQSSIQLHHISLEAIRTMAVIKTWLRLTAILQPTGVRPPLIPFGSQQALWLQVVDNWSLDKKLQFVAFVTGGQRPCPMGPEVLNIVLSFVPPQHRDQASMLQRLPVVRPSCEQAIEDLHIGNAYRAPVEPACCRGHEGCRCVCLQKGLEPWSSGLATT